MPRRSQPPLGRERGEAEPGRPASRASEAPTAGPAARAPSGPSSRAADASGARPSPKMARPSGWLLLELALDAAALLAALGCAAALGLAQGGFGGRCILYGSVGYNGTLNLLSSSPPSLCYFISAISALTAIFTLVSLLRGLYSLCYGDGHLVHAWIRTSLVVSATLLFFLLVTACVLRVGMDVFCGSIRKSKAAASCQEAQQRAWVQPYRPGQFYNNLYAAQATAWVNFLFWFSKSFLLFVECIRKAPYQPLEEGSPRTDKTGPASDDQPH